MTSAAAISGKLRKAGFNPIGSGSSRLGLKVRGGLRWSAVGPSVSVTLEGDREAARLSAAAEEALNEAGYETSRYDDRLFSIVETNQEA